MKQSLYHLSQICCDSLSYDLDTLHVSFSGMSKLGLVKSAFNLGKNIPKIGVKVSSLSKKMGKGKILLSPEIGAMASATGSIASIIAFGAQPIVILAVSGVAIAGAKKNMEKEKKKKALEKEKKLINQLYKYVIEKNNITIIPVDQTTKTYKKDLKKIEEIIYPSTSQYIKSLLDASINYSLGGIGAYISAGNAMYIFASKRVSKKSLKDGEEMIEKKIQLSKMMKISTEELSDTRKLYGMVKRRRHATKGR